jgi:hypothetical protein
VLSGNALVGEWLTAAAGSWDAGVTLSYRWFSESGLIAGASGASLLLTEDLLGEVIHVEVTASKDGYHTVSVLSEESGLVSLPPVVLQHLTLTSKPEITGEPIVGDLLEARLGQWNAGVSFGYRWLRDGAAIVGATALTYLVSELDLGHELSFEVTASKDGFETVTVLSDATDLVIGAMVAPEAQQRGPITDLVAPTIAGTARVGGMLTKTGQLLGAGAGSGAGLGALDNQVQTQAATVFEYQWLRNGVAIFGATAASYEPHDADLGAMLSLRVTAQRDGYDTTVVTSAAVGPILERVATPPTVVTPGAGSGGAGAGGGGGGGAMPPSPIELPAMNRGLPSGASNAVFGADGSVLESTATVAADGKGLALQGAGWRINIGAESGMSVGPSGAAELVSGARVELRASGYQPGSLVQAYLVPKTYLQLASFDLRLATIAAEPIDLGSTEVSEAGEFELAVVPRAAAGEYQLQLVGTLGSGELVALALLTELADAELGNGSGLQVARGWTRAMADGTVKFYARDLVGVGKVRFMLNGREVAWVRAVDASDPKLNVGPAAARDGLTRTVGAGTRWSLAAGRNVLEIWVGDNRLVRRIFTR